MGVVFLCGAIGRMGNVKCKSGWLKGGEQAGEGSGCTVIVDARKPVSQGATGLFVRSPSPNEASAVCPQFTQASFKAMLTAVL